VKRVFIPGFLSHRIAHLLQGPSRSRMGRDVAMDQAPAAVLNHHEYVQQAKRRGDGDGEIGLPLIYVSKVMAWTPLLLTASVVPKWKCQATT
jgi:hypothetical protein